MRISRHYVRVQGRRVHYRRAGAGPAVLLVHQSPRSSAEWLPLMERWAERFTVIAPDTPGFGQSDPLPGDRPEIDDFANALIDLLDALGIARTAAYGFHSGGIILMAALRRDPARFSAAAIGGYAIWTEAERAAFGDAYLPPFHPSAYGEHLTWLWNRILEQSWFFPWFDVRDAARLSVARDDPVRVDATVRDMLDSGDAYRAGYGAVLRAPRDVPPPGAAMPPALITAYDGDPLQPHIDRLGALPEGWSAVKVRTPAEQQDRTFAFLSAHPAPVPPPAPALPDEGFSWVEGLQLHWRGAGEALRVHPPGRSLETQSDALAIDLPGHGLSDAWNGRDWDEIVNVAARALGAGRVEQAPAPAGDPDRLYPNLTPDRFGSYLTRAWSVVRARAFFSPWYEADAAHATAFDPATIAPERLAIAHRELLRATAARDYHRHLAGRD